MLRQIGWIFLCISMLVACQRTDPSEQNTGIDRELHSYNYVGYQENKMVIAAESIDAVDKAKVTFNGRNIIMDVYVKPGTQAHNYALIAAQVRRKVTQASPMNVFILHVHPAKENLPTGKPIKGGY